MGTRGQSSQQLPVHRPHINVEDLQEDVFEALKSNEFEQNETTAWDILADPGAVMLHEVYDEGKRPGHTPPDTSSWDDIYK